MFLLGSSDCATSVSVLDLVCVCLFCFVVCSLVVLLFLKQQKHCSFASCEAMDANLNFLTSGALWTWSTCPTITPSIYLVLCKIVFVTPVEQQFYWNRLWDIESICVILEMNFMFAKCMSFGGCHVERGYGNLALCSACTSLV